MVKLVALPPPHQPRTPGLLAGQGWEAPDCWAPEDQPLGESADGPLFHGAVEEPPAPQKP